MNTISKEFVYLFFPKRCIVCNCVIATDRFLCDDCEDSLKPIEVKVCKRCGNTKAHCACGRYVYHFRGAAAPYINDGAAQSAIYGYKMRPNKDAADYFAAHMASHFKKIFPDVIPDCVTSVPTSIFKKIGKCFDHSAYLAKAVAKEMALPYKPLLFEKSKQKAQHKLNAAERFKNVKGAYKAKKNTYTNVLLIDDIKTTGASLDECTRQLMLSGTENVYVLTAVTSS